MNHALEERTMLSEEKIAKTYASTRAVDALSFEVRPGEICGLIGPKCAGKSTTIGN